ncbi:MAG: vWA domain-containing protein [Candidatus Eiseniibacteriota bacterium]
MPIFSFLNPSFLWALPATAIPVLIHLLSRRRLPEVAFPTTQFLRQLEPREIRRLRLRELLLLILRTLAILLLVLALARPSLTPPHAVTHAAAAAEILIDDSESMAALDEQARPRMETAKQRARAILDAARPGDEMALVTSTRPDASEARHTSDRVRLLRALDRIEATLLPARLTEAISGAKRSLTRSRLAARELYVISDLQASNFTPEARAEIRAASAAGIRVYVVPVVQSRVPNHAIQDVDPELRPGPEGSGLELRARFANHADAASDRVAVRVRRGDALIGGGDVTLRAEENRWLSMPLDWRGAPDSLASVRPVVVEADQDALPADDRWFAALGAPRRLRVLRIAEARDGVPPPRFSALALDPGRDGSGGFVVEQGTPASLLSLTASRADVVLLEDVASLSADAEGRLRAFHRDGGGLVVALGPHSDPAYYTSRFFPGLIDLALDGVEHAPAGAPFELRAKLPSHEVLEGLSVTVGAPLTQSRLTGMVRARPLSSRTETVVQTSGGLPVVAAAPGISVFLSSLSDDWGDLPYSGAFVPLVRGMVAHAARAARMGGASALRVGERPVARLSTTPGSAVIVRGPEGYASQAAVEAEGTGYRGVADTPALQPGFYTYEAGGKTLATVAVNVDAIESDLAPIDTDSLRVAAAAQGASGASAGAVTILKSGNALATHLVESRRGRELWLGFLLAAVIALSCELMLGSAKPLRS